MVRRTKADAQATRDSILDAAEMLFAEQGVSRTTLQHIATAAMVTRGAIYWHFVDKTAVFNAMMDRVVLPMEQALYEVDDANVADPIEVLRDWVANVLSNTVHDPKTRRVFEISTHKIEYIDELDGARERYLASHNRWLKRTETMLKIAVKRGQIKTQLTPFETAQGLWAMMDGLIRSWLHKPTAFDLLRCGQRISNAYLDALLAAAKCAMKK